MLHQPGVKSAVVGALAVAVDGQCEAPRGLGPVCREQAHHRPPPGRAAAVAQPHGAVAVASEQSQAVARCHAGPGSGGASGPAHGAQQFGVDETPPPDAPVTGDEAQQPKQVGGGGGQLAGRPHAEALWRHAAEVAQVAHRQRRQRGTGWRDGWWRRRRNRRCGSCHRHTERHRLRHQQRQPDRPVGGAVGHAQGRKQLTVGPCLVAFADRALDHHAQQQEAEVAVRELFARRRAQA